MGGGEVSLVLALSLMAHRNKAMGAEVERAGGLVEARGLGGMWWGLKYSMMRCGGAL